MGAWFEVNWISFHEAYWLLEKCPGFIWDRANSPPSSYSVLDLVWEECWQHWCVQLLLRNRGLFSRLPYSANEQVCRSWERAQPGSQPKMAGGNIPHRRCHAQFTDGGWPGGRNLLFPFSWVQILSCPRVQTFLGIQSFSGILWNLQFSGSVFTAWGLAGDQSSGGEKNYIAYNLVCIFFIVIIIIVSISIISISIYLVVLLESLYLNSQVSTFVHFSSSSCWRGRGRVSEQLSGPSCQLPG